MKKELHFDGESTDAVVKTTNIDEATKEQIQEIVDHEAFDGDIVIMPDAHYGAGAVIGFTMPLGEYVVPNTVGMDIGCGMYAVNYGPELPLPLEELDREVRKAVPFGFEVNSGTDYHVGNDFPWEECKEKLQVFGEEVLGREVDEDWFDGYGIGYFKNVCERTHTDVNRAICSMGTLGGGNHFIEFSKSVETGDYWCVIHSGSRGIGGNIAQHWQEWAHIACDDRPHRIRDFLKTVPDRYYKFNEDATGDKELLDWVQGGMGEDWKRMDVVAEDNEGEEIEEWKNTLNKARLIAKEGFEHPLNYLLSEVADGYFIDMIFAQRYASENRKEMMRRITDILGVEPVDSIESIHNYADFEDGIIRKGATPAHDGERGVIPFNMAEGSLIVEGKGNPDWNYSAPHGAGRRMSRSQAFRELSFDDYAEVMDGIYSTSVTEETLDEAPMAYKDSDMIEGSIAETATVVERLEPVMNLKAE